MSILIDNRRVGAGSPAYIIAELSANHNGDYAVAETMIQAAKDAGADAVKLQTYTADTITMDSDLECFTIRGGTLWDEKTLYELYQQAATPWDWQPRLKAFADSIGITLFSSPFDATAVDFLEEMNVPAYKIASFEAVDIPLIEYTASTGKPIIISTGICSEEEIHEAIAACYRVGNQDVILLKCTSAYPAALESMNLATIPAMQETFGCEVGLSDHTMNIETPVAAIALGASVIEKHFIMDRALGGPDAGFSLDIHEFRDMVTAVRNTETLLGSPNYAVREDARRLARSLFVHSAVQKGDPLTKNNIRSVRPNNGLSPKHWNDVLGRKVKTDLEPGTPLRWEDIEGERT